MQIRGLTLSFGPLVKSFAMQPVFLFIFMACWLKYLLITYYSLKRTTQHSNVKHPDENFYGLYEVILLKNEWQTKMH